MHERKIGYYFIVMASVIIVLAGVKSASVILVPFLLSLFIAIILSPAFNYLNAKGLPQSLSITVVIALFLLLLVLVARLIGNSVNDFSANIDMYSERLSIYYISISHYLQEYGITIPIQETSELINTKQIMGFATQLLQNMGSMFTNGFVIILTVVFMLFESKHFVQKISYADDSMNTMKSISEIFSQIKNYMVLKAIISALTGLIVWIALIIIGTEYAFLWAVLAFLLNFIPNIGSIIAAVPAILITLVQLGGVSTLIVSVLYISINVIIGSIVEPKLMGRGLGLSTLVVFLSLLFWGWLLGMVGMLLSIPLTIMAKIILNTQENTRWIAVLLGTGEHIELKQNK